MEYQASPNCGPRRHLLMPDMVVIHYTAMKSAQSAVERLCDPKAEVSAHFVIAEDGVVTSLVPQDLRAWHAGAGSWGEVVDVNSHSIGFELANGGPQSAAPAFPEAQMRALESVLGDTMTRFGITPDRVIGHSDMAPGRKVDPGPYFDWQRLAAKDLSIWCEPSKAAPDWSLFTDAALKFGYRAPALEPEGWDLVLAAFRLRFRPNAIGPLDVWDVGTIQELARRWPCRAVDLGGAKSVHP